MLMLCSDAGVVEALGQAAGRITALLQQPQDLSKPHLQAVVALGSITVKVLLRLAIIWPQMVLSVKAFAQALTPWASLAAELPAAAAILQQTLSSADMPSIMRAVCLTAGIIASQISESPRASKDDLEPPNESVRQFYLSGGLQRLMLLNCAIATCAKHIQSSGSSTAPAIVGQSNVSEAASSGGSKHSRPKQQQPQRLQVPAYHTQLLQDLGLQDKHIPPVMLSFYQQR